MEVRFGSRACSFDGQQVSLSLFSNREEVLLFVAVPFFLSGIILDVIVATVIIEVLVALITDCPTATGSRMGFVSDRSSQYGDLRRDIGTT